MQNFQKDRKNYATMYIVRHGETNWNARKLVQGHSDIPLNSNGKKQARTLLKKLQNVVFDLVFSSDLSRARQTAEIIALEKKLAVTTTEALRERAFGEYEGKNRDILDKIDTVIEKLPKEQQLSYKHIPDMESNEEVIVRVITFLRVVAVANPGKTILMVSHGATMYTLLQYLGFGANGYFPNGRIGNAAYAKLLSDGVNFFIEETQGINIVLE